jgi:hypothetical protein
VFSGRELIGGILERRLIIMRIGWRGDWSYWDKDELEGFVKMMVEHVTERELL